MADSCIALSELVIKYKKLSLPQTYYEAFDILGENKILEPGFAFSFAKIAGFRNFLAHDYEKIAEQRYAKMLYRNSKMWKDFLGRLKALWGLTGHKRAECNYVNLLFKVKNETILRIIK